MSENTLKTDRLTPLQADVALAKAGDLKARGRVVVALEGMCHFAAKRYAPFTHVSMDELVQQARVAVLSAIDAFNPRFNVAFHTYAFRWMRALLRLCIEENPGDRRNKKHRTVLARGRVSNVRVQARLVSLEAPVSPHSDATVAEVVPLDEAPADEQLGAEQRTRQLHALVSSLGPEDRAVIRGRLNGKTLEDIGASMGLSRERARQIQKRAVVKMRNRAAARRFA